MVKLNQFTLIIWITLYLIGCAPPSQPATVATHPSATASPTDAEPTPVPVDKKTNSTPTALLSSPTPASRATLSPTHEVDTEQQNMALISGAKEGNAAAVRDLLAQGASVHASDERGVTALIASAYQNQLEVARLLIEAGADVNVKDDTQQSAYLIPTADGYLEFLKLTLQSGADVHSLDSYNGTGLIRAADRGHIEIIEELLETDIYIDHVNRLGWTALLEAIILGDGGQRHTEVVRLLVQAGADVNLVDSNGVTPLAHASQRGFKEIVAILEIAGAR